MIIIPALKLALNRPDEVDRLEPTITIQVFRIVQECLANIIRHAQATEACITLTIEHEPNRLLLLVCGNGLGCAADQIKSGFGLLGMRERLNSLGGEFSIQTGPQQGMTNIASIPLA